MDHESVLLESRTMRASLTERTEALDKVKALELLPDGLHVTTRMVADYFEVGERAVNAVMHRHRHELESNGMVLLQGAELQEFLSCNVQLRTPGRGLRLFPRRAVLNVAMLLRDSEVARQVRRRLLDLVERPARLPVDWPEALVREVAERAAPAVRAEVDELQAANAALAAAHAALARQLDRERDLVAAMSLRLADTTTEMRTLGGRVEMLCALLAAPGHGRRRRPRTCRC